MSKEEISIPADDELAIKSTIKTFEPNKIVDRTHVEEFIKVHKDKYISETDGKEFIRFKGLLDIAHHLGLTKITTEILKIDLDKNECLMKATAEYRDGSIFTGYGHASPNNLEKFLSSSFIAMAETRAINRALRFGNNVGMTSLEELPDKKSADYFADAKMEKASNTIINKILNIIDTDEKYDKVIKLIQKQYNVNSLTDLSEQQAKKILEFLEKLQKEAVEKPKKKKTIATENKGGEKK